MRFDLRIPESILRSTSTDELPAHVDVSLVAIEGLAMPACPVPPATVAVDLIDEDPGQPRKEFGDAALGELAESIRQLGVLQPISVRPHPSDAGRWMLNFGARRLRASKLAGKPYIPAHVDLCANEYAQVIENEQRENLKPLELALFVQRRLAAGESQAEIAQRLCKSRSYVTFVMALIDAPAWLLDAYRAGRCTGIRELYELRRLSTKEPAAVATLVAGGDRITRDMLNEASNAAAIRKSGRPNVAIPAFERQSAQAPGSAAGSAPLSAGHQDSRSMQPAARSRFRVMARHAGRLVELIINAAPESDGEFFIRVDAEACLQCVPADEVQLVGFERQ